MKLSDVIAGTALFIGGAIIHLTNYKRSDKQGKVRSRVGLGLMFGGAMIALGEWMVNLVLSGR